MSPNMGKTALVSSSIVMITEAITGSQSIWWSDHPPGCSALFHCSSLVRITLPTLKFCKTSNFSKGGTPGYCVMAIHTSWTVPDNSICTRRRWTTYIGYCDKESANSGYFLYRTFLKMAVEYAPILDLFRFVFTRRQERSLYCLLNFSKGKIWIAQTVHTFLEYLRCITIPSMVGNANTYVHINPTIQVHLPLQ